MIMNDYYVIQYLRKVSLGGEGGAASCSGICARVGGAAACSASGVCARVGGAAACSGICARVGGAAACSGICARWEELPPAASERELLPAAVQPVLAPVAVPEYLGARVVAARGDLLALCPCIGE